MFKKIRTIHGQAMMTEYIVIFFLVIGAIVSMSVFVQRSIQARIHDARTYMLNEAARAHGGNIQYEYEPYYAYTDSNVMRSQDDTGSLFEGGGTGIFRKNAQESAATTTYSTQAPPKDAR